MISGHISAGQYILFQRDPSMSSAPLLEVGRLVVLSIDDERRVEHWYLYTNAPIGSGYAKYIRPSAAYAGTPVGLSFRGNGAPPATFDENAYLARLTLATGCTIEYIQAGCDRLATNTTTTLAISAAMPGTPQQVDLGAYDIMQASRRVGVLVVTPVDSGTLEAWHLFEGGKTTNEGPYVAPDPSVGGAYALTFVQNGIVDLTGRAIVTVNALCAVAA
jgi:hypothetical protein